MSADNPPFVVHIGDVLRWNKLELEVVPIIGTEDPPPPDGFFKTVTQHGTTIWINPDAHYIRGDDRFLVVDTSGGTDGLLPLDTSGYFQR